MGISLCMITKDEENYIANCLDSIKDFVDEIIIVDTGSSDNTCPIVESYNTKLFYYTWEDDFSKARNFGIEKASEDWIIYLDADEIIEDACNLKEIINYSDIEDIDAYLFQIINYSDNKITEIETSTSARLFRNKKEYRFTGRIHEQLPLDVEKTAMCDLIIKHYGYTPLANAKKNKSARNLLILKKTLEENPLDGFVYFNLGNEYMRLNQIEEALKHYKKSLELTDKNIGYESRLYKMLGIALISLNKHEEFILTIEEGIHKFPDYPDLYFLRAQYNTEFNQYEKAIADFNKCLIMNGENIHNNIYAYEDGITSYKSYYYLGLIYEKKLMFEKAIDSYLTAILLNSDYMSPLLRIEKLFINNIDNTLESISKIDLKSKILLADRFLKMKKLNICRLIIKTTEEKQLSDKNRYEIGIIYFGLSDYKKVIKFLSETKDYKNNNIHYLIVSYYMDEQSLIAENLILNAKDPIKLYKKSLELFASHQVNMLDFP